MKREDVSQIFTGATDEQINAILDINSKDIGSAKAKTDSLTEQITALNDQIKQRDADIKSLGDKLTAAQADAGKLTDAQTAQENHSPSKTRGRSLRNINPDKAGL